MKMKIMKISYTILKFYIFYSKLLFCNQARINSKTNQSCAGVQFKLGVYDAEDRRHETE